MFIIGLTGGIASGKSTVAGMMRDCGCVVIDADLIAREVVEAGKPAHQQIVAAFGQSVLLPSGELNRPALGEIIFNDQSKRKLLNKCTHPCIHRQMMYQLARSFVRGHPFVVMELPLLYETGAFLKYFHKVIVVNCTHDQEVERLMLRNSLTEEQALARINVQLSLEEKCRRADMVISNVDGRDQTRQQTVAIVTALRSSWRHVVIRLLAVSVVALPVFALRWTFS